MMNSLALKFNQVTSYFPVRTRESQGERRKILLVNSHPNPSSFSHAIAKAVEEGAIEGGHSIRRIDLYSSGFNPVLSKKEHNNYLSNIEGDQGIDR